VRVAGDVGWRQQEEELAAHVVGVVEHELRVLLESGLRAALAAAEPELARRDIALLLGEDRLELEPLNWPAAISPKLPAGTPRVR
jgi:hypothetical protein